jgi:hypothetical protein
MKQEREGGGGLKEKGRPMKKGKCESKKVVRMQMGQNYRQKGMQLPWKGGGL